MNSPYFLCRDHGVYIDAGYRWAYWQLEHTGLVTMGTRVDLAAVLSATSYWQPSADEQSTYLSDLLPRIRRFLDLHAGHDVVYLDEQWLSEMWELGYDYKEQEQ